jgi:hypothetical protein
VWTTGAGTQSRYFILAGALASVYAAAAIGGVLRRSRRLGLALAALALALALSTAGFTSGEGHLWACRDAPLRAIADSVQARAGNDHVVWIGDRGAYFYACRTRLPVHRYHALGRSDDVPAAVRQQLLDARASALVCVEEKPVPMAHWEVLRTGWRGRIEALPPLHDYRLFRMQAGDSAP